MGAHHNHDHQTKNKKVLTIAFILTFIFTTIEIVFGFVYQSLSLLSEGFHMLSDSVSLLLGLLAVVIGAKKASNKKTFGYRRIETLAALFNGLALLVIPVFVVTEAVERFMNQKEVMGSGMLKVALIGLFINILVAFILSRGEKEENLNLRAAFLHVFADITSSVGVILASLIIIYYEFYLIDPIVSVLVSIVIFIGGLRVTRESWNVLMESVPEGTDVEKLRYDILSVEGVESIRSLNVWSIASGENYIMASITVMVGSNEQEVLKKVKKLFCEHEYKTYIEIKK